MVQFHKTQTRFHMQTIKIFSFLALLSVLATGCAVNPVTGKNELSLIPESQELAIGAQQYGPSQQSQGGIYSVDPELTKYVNEVGQKLAVVSDRKLPYEFVVLNNSVPNAWALPGGKIAVNRGLLMQLDTEAELAAVLGHEIVHAAAKHGANAMQRGMVLQGLLAVTALSAANSDYANYIIGGAQVGAQLISTRHGRDAELEADYYGMQYMARAGYDPAAAISLQETFVQLSEGRQSNWIDGLFASHPPSIDRVNANIRTAAELNVQGITNGRQYMSKMAYMADKQPAYDAFDEAGVLANKNEFETANLNLDKAIQLEPAEARFHGLRGDILLAQKRYQEAEEEFSIALDRDDSYYEYYLGRGLAKSKRGMAQEAREDLTRSNELLPTAIAANALGEISLNFGDRKAAKTYFQSAMTAGGAAGARAQNAYLQLDVTDEPVKYLKVQAQLSEQRELLALLSNGSPAEMSDVSLEFLATLNGQPIRRMISVKSLASGASGSVSSGWTIRETDQLENLNIKVLSANASF
jgi:predicted Zn-dependent protease